MAKFLMFICIIILLPFAACNVIVWGGAATIIGGTAAAIDQARSGAQ
jgi:hypothetical protein